MPNATRFSQAPRWPLARLLATLLLALGLSTPARATAGPPATGRPLAEALNPDGTLKAGAAGSFDARAFRMGTGPDGRPVFRPVGTTGAGDERWADGFGMSNGVDGTINVVVQSGTDTYVGGNFTLAGGAVVNSVAKWNGTAWSSLAGGVNGSVYALAVASNGEVYVGGNLIQAGGIAVNRVAKWNGTAWSSLGTGVTGGSNNYGKVNALAVTSNGEVYVGGDFTQAGGVAVSNVAKWNGTAWSSLGTGITGGSNNYGNIVALAVASSGEVYVGGEFTQAGGVAAKNVAKWNGTAWSSLGTGVGYFGSLAVASSGEVYVCGYFSQAGGVAANNVAKWNGTAWSSLGSGVNGNVRALALASTGEVYVGGDFTQAGGVAVSNVAKWNGTAWSSLGTGIISNSGNVYTLAVANSGEVYVGGSFYQAGGVAVNSAAKWNGTAWSGLGTGTGNGVGGSVSALAVASSGEVYVGGIFYQAGGVAVSSVAKWNGTAWSSLGTGVTGGSNNYGKVNALAVTSSGEVYVGGEFTQAGGVAVNNVAKWNGAVWSRLGTGVNSKINALAVASSGEVYVGGDFSQAGGVAANNVAKWNGTAWSSLGGGVNRSVYALAVASSGEVYVGGFFQQAGGVAINNVARWNGLNWSSLGTGVNFYVFQLATGPTNQLYAGGNFTKTGDGGKAMAGFAIYDPAAPLATEAAKAAPAAQLFPNPAHGTATLRLPATAARLPLALSDALGRLVRQYPAPAGAEAVLDLRGLPAGVYLVRCGELSQRLVVE